MPVTKHKNLLLSYDNTDVGDRNLKVNVKCVFFLGFYLLSGALQVKFKGTEIFRLAFNIQSHKT